MKRTLTVVLTVLLLALASQESARSQQTNGKWVVGLHGGPNVWISDFNKLKIDLGGEFLLGYGLSRYFSLALTGGYEELKTDQDPILTDLDYGYRLSSLKLKAITSSVVAILHFSPGSSFNPYFYAGVGAFSFKRLANSTIVFPDGGTFPAGLYLPDIKSSTSLMIPLGIGFEFFTSKSISLTIDIGARSLGDWIDFRRNTSLDGMLTTKAGIHFYLGSSDDDDDDEDGLSNGEERRYGTDPKNPDTDGDGLKDGEEVKRYRTNPLRQDTDGDGLSDGDEVMKYKTNPTKIDSDNDGLTDGDEVLKYKTDPLKPDTDGDLLSDGDEVNVYLTDPLKVDTDGDGLSDYDEVITYKTDPTNPDTDKDGITDGEEVHRYHTNPLKADTDGGGVPDGVEVKRGTNPLDPSDDMPSRAIKLEKGKTVVLEGVTFESGSARLTRSSETVLQKVLEALKQSLSLRVEIAGYTDNVGSVETNDKLSMSRAVTVRMWLMARGIGAHRLTAIGYGSRHPIASNLTSAGRAKNRRIEFHVM